MIKNSLHFYQVITPKNLEITIITCNSFLEISYILQEWFKERQVLITCNYVESDDGEHLFLTLSFDANLKNNVSLYIYHLLKEKRLVIPEEHTGLDYFISNSNNYSKISNGDVVYYEVPEVSCENLNVRLYTSYIVLNTLVNGDPFSNFVGYSTLKIKGETKYKLPVLIV